MVCEPMQNAVCEILVRIVRSSPHISWGWDLVWRRGNNPHTITEFYLTTNDPAFFARVTHDEANLRWLVSQSVS